MQLGDTGTQPAGSPRRHPPRAQAAVETGWPTDKGSLGKPETPKRTRSAPALPDGPGEPRGRRREARGSAGAGGAQRPRLPGGSRPPWPTGHTPVFLADGNTRLPVQTENRATQ